MTQQENLEMVVDQLSEMGFHKTNMFIYLDGCAGMETIPYFQRDRIRDDEMSYQVTIQRDKSGLYHPEGYQATLLKTHPVPHFLCGAIDTKKLEEQMQWLDWNKSLREVAYDPKATQIYDVVFELSTGSKQAKDIASRLMLRYWRHTPIEQHLNINKNISDYQQTLYFSLNNGLSDIHAREAYNLLSGRGVMKFYEKENEPNRFYSNWKVIENEQLVTLPDYDFMTQLKKLSIVELDNKQRGPQIINNLIRGERSLVHLNKENQQVLVYIEANPREQSLILYNKESEKLDLQKYLKDGSLQVKRNIPTSQKINPIKKKPGKNKGRSL